MTTFCNTWILPLLSLRAPDLVLRMHRKENSPLMSLRRSAATVAISILTQQKPYIFLGSLQSRPWQFHFSHQKGRTMGERQFYVYLMTNKGNTVLYTGVTNNLRRRVYEHKEKLTDGFTKKYNIVKLVYYEVFQDSLSAIQREKQIKAGSRKKKEQLINSINNQWCDLFEQL